MSRERKEPNAIWQGRDNPNWDDSFEEEMPPLADEQDEVVADSNPSSTFPKDEFEVDELMESPPEPFFTRFELLRQIGHQLSPLLVPLLFGGLTFLFILPVALGGHFYLQAGYLWPTALVIIALAVLQGMLLYYAGSNNVYWTLAVIGGFLLFLLVGCFALSGFLTTAILFAVLVIACSVVTRLYLHPVQEGSVDIVYSFGKYKRTLFPGLNFLLPWEWVDSHLHTRERQWTCPEQTVQVSRSEDVHIKATISYQLMPEDAYLAITHVEDWEKSLQDMFIVCLQNVCNQLTPDDFIIWPQRSGLQQTPNLLLNNPVAEEEARWEHINTILFQHMREPVALWGVIINWVQIRDITLTPRPPKTYDTDQMASIGTATASNQPPQAQPSQGPDTSGRVATPPVQSAQPGAPVAAKSPEDATATITKLPDERVLKDAYEQIKSGRVTSPEVIRKIAASFQAIADNPEASKNVSFDAARAAQTLYERANFFEDQSAIMAADYEDDTPTQVDWSYRRPKDDNYTAGG